MAIYLPGTVDEEQIALDELTPREIVAELDKHVIGQKDAKRAVAIALRNRMRRQKLTPELAEEVIPKNIIMIGPTGVGKTEIARRLAKLANSPFLKVEASKFTEVGYVGRDVESMIRDLVEIAIEMVREEKLEDVADKAELNAEERLLDILLPPTAPPSRPAESAQAGFVLEGTTSSSSGSGDSQSRTREKLRQQLREGKLDERMVEIDVRERAFPSFEIISNQGVEEMDVNIKDMLPNIFGQRTKKRKMKVNEAFEYLIQEEEQRLIDMDQVTRTAIDRVEDSGIIFLDEIDKIAGRESGHGPDVSREGVQRDIRLVLGLRGGECACRACPRCRGQRGGAYQEGGRCGQAAPRVRPAGRTLKLGRDVLIGLSCRLGPVPGAAIGISSRVGGLGNGLVGPAAFPCQGAAW